MAEKNNDTLNSIQILRGIAAVAVMLVHHQAFIPLPANAPFGKIIPGGSWGVDLFFLISGFIAAYTVSPSSIGTRAGANYLLRRLIRILPLYYILTMLSFGSDATAWLHSLKSMLFIPIGGDYGPTYGGAQIGQGWTLNYEMYFYLVVAVSFVFGNYKWLFSITLISSVIGLPLMLNSLPENYLIYGFSFPSTYFSLITHPIVFEFLAGSLLGMYYPRMRVITSQSETCLYFCFVGIFLYNVYAPHWVGHGLQGWGFPCLLLLLAMLKLEKSGFRFNNRALLHLGACSYSIYLLHENIKNIFIKIAKHAAHLFVMPDILILVLSLATTFIVAHYTHKIIEVRLSDWLKTRLLQKRLTGGASVIPPYR
ncbi:acyltransferase family protein [Enterobacter cancerogenus]|uniref:acyltransferase family protein n=1 Tax=Enterobacter cancerogenus TaxID=69218 RepID=UPI00384B7967